MFKNGKNVEWKFYNNMYIIIGIYSSLLQVLNVTLSLVIVTPAENRVNWC